MKLDYPATHRNRDPILAVLREVLPAGGVVLEIASGSGQHTAWFAAALPHLSWRPTDLGARELQSIDAWSEGLANVAPARRLDVLASWPAVPADALLCCNMIHIAPWACTPALFAGAAGVLPSGAPLILYGPFSVDGVHTAPSNAVFDASLRSRDPSWGVRDRSRVREVAASHGFVWERGIDMPANNQTLVFRRAPRGQRRR